MAWTTTPWTLPSNTALAVGAKIKYVVVKTFTPNTDHAVVVILAKDLLHKYFPEKNSEVSFEDYKAGDKAIPFEVLVKSFRKRSRRNHDTNNFYLMHSQLMAMHSEFYSEILLQRKTEQVSFTSLRVLVQTIFVLLNKMESVL
jgi:isoleucyl-tRNA synthetase